MVKKLYIVMIVCYIYGYRNNKNFKNLIDVVTAKKTTKTRARNPLWKLYGNGRSFSTDTEEVAKGKTERV